LRGARPERAAGGPPPSQKKQDELRKELEYDQHYMTIEELEERYNTDR